MTNKSICFINSCNEQYKKFILPYIYSASIHHINQSKFEFLLINCDIDQKLRDGLNFLICNGIVNSNNCLLQPIKTDIHVASYRYLIDQTLSSDYTYIGDIDVLLMENIIGFHEDRLIDKNGNYYIYDNEFRSYNNKPFQTYKNSDRLSGLHFVKTKEWFNITKSIRRKYFEYGRECNAIPNEILLGKILIESKCNVRPLIKTAKEFTLNRPIHGQHLSLHRLPFKHNSTIKNVVFPLYKDEFIKLLHDKMFQTLLNLFDQEYKTILFQYLKFNNIDLSF